MIEITRTSWSSYRLYSSVRLPRPQDEVFRFFSDPHQLEALTPKSLHFRILTPPPITMQAGTVIDYWLKVHGIPLRWQSLISVWDPPHRFVDEQTRGPYRRWRHEHRFTADKDATLVEDLVDYSVYGGSLVHRWLVEPDLTAIFRYREGTLLRIFGAASSLAAVD